MHIWNHFIHVRDVCVCVCILSRSGTTTIAVGAPNDDDSKTGSGTNRGAVYILFLNSDGTLRSEQKISDTQGGLTAALAEGDWFGRSVANVGDLDDE